MFRELEHKAVNGYAAVVVSLLLGGLAMERLVDQVRSDIPSPLLMVLYAVVLTLACTALAGFFTVAPNDSKVLTLFGSYVGSVRTPGLWWTNPFMTRKRVSLRVRNFETAKLKVNDANSNPIEIAAVVVWKVVDTAEALFEVDDYSNYVHVQSESALRGLASSYPYDAHVPNEQSLSTHTPEVSKGLSTAIQERVEKAGVEIIEARISHLAYSPEIASAMLRRQQASAIIAARYKIVEGAVGMVENALDLLSQKGVIVLDEERKAQMVSNLLVVLCSDRDAQPVVNTGTIYQ